MRNMRVPQRLVACDDKGMPNFYRCMFTDTIAARVWAFDLLPHNGRDCAS